MSLRPLLQVTATALLACAALHASAQSKPPKGDTRKQLADGIDMEMTAIMAGLVQTCKSLYPARTAEYDSAWAKNLKTAPAQVVAYTRTKEFRTKSEQYSTEQRAEAAKPGQESAIEEVCNGLAQ